MYPLCSYNIEFVFGVYKYNNISEFLNNTKQYTDEIKRDVDDFIEYLKNNKELINKLRIVEHINYDNDPNPAKKDMLKLDKDYGMFLPTYKRHDGTYLPTNFYIDCKDDTVITSDE